MSFTPALLSVPLPTIEHASTSHTNQRHRKRSSVRITISSRPTYPAAPCPSLESACGCFSVTSQSSNLPRVPAPSSTPSTSPALECTIQPSQLRPNLEGALKLERHPTRPVPTPMGVVSRMSVAVGNVFDGVLGYSIPNGWIEQGGHEDGYESNVAVNAWRARVHQELGGQAGWEENC
ncbi:hypothetical protein RQP46_006821 [Phenoliferia psychrophenolica]